MNTDPPDHAMQRSIELEARFSWLERHVAEQDKVILELGDTVRSLKRETQELKRRLNESLVRASEDGPEERPPHY